MESRCNRNLAHCFFWLVLPHQVVSFSGRRVVHLVYYRVQGSCRRTSSPFRRDFERDVKEVLASSKIKGRIVAALVRQFCFEVGWCGVPFLLADLQSVSGVLFLGGRRVSHISEPSRQRCFGTTCGPFGVHFCRFVFRIVSPMARGCHSVHLGSSGGL